MFNQGFILLQAGAGGGMSSLIMFGLMMVIFWLFIIRPQAKRQREQKSFIDALEKGTEVVTSSGIIGRINKIEGDIVTLEVSKQIFMRFTKSAISKEMTDALAKSPTAAKEQSSGD